MMVMLGLYTGIQVYTGIHRCTQVYTGIHRYTQVYTGYTGTQVYRYMYLSSLLLVNSTSWLLVTDTGAVLL